MTIITFDKYWLSQKSAPVEPHVHVPGLIAEMREALAGSSNGVGLAASQVGQLWRVILVRDTIMINPVISWRSKKERTAQEGCLSFPSIYIDVRRPREVKIEYEDEERVARMVHLQGLEARIACHEMDHLDGICLVGDEWEKQHP